jgi:hypothetical protein
VKELGKIKNIILAYVILGIIFVALVHLGIATMDIGGAFNVLFIIFSPFTFLYTTILAMLIGAGLMI